MAASVDELTRDGLWEAMQSRRRYGTTGERTLLSVDLDGANMGEKIGVDGDATFDVTVNGTSPSKRVDLFDGSEMVESVDLTDADLLLELTWSGARSKHRHKVQNADGGRTLDRGELEDGMVVEAGGLDQQLAFRYVGEATEKDVDVSFAVDADDGTEGAYYVRTVQEDGDTAWSSPVFVTAE